MNDHKKYTSIPGLSHIFIGTTYWSTLIRFSRWEGPVWAQSARAYFKLYIPSIAVTQLFREQFGVLLIWLRDLTFLWQACFRSYVSFEPSPTKQSSCVQNPTSYTGLFQPSARLCIINIISLPLELRLFNWKESVVFIKMVELKKIELNSFKWQCI